MELFVVLLIIPYGKSSLSYLLLHELSLNESPVEISPVVLEISRNKQKERQKDKIVKKICFGKSTVCPLNLLSKKPLS